MKNIKNKIICFIVLACALLFTGCAKSYEVVFEVNGGEGITTVTLKENTEYTLLTPVKENYQFDGWYLTSDFSGEKVTSLTITDNVTVYAKWIQLATIKLELDGGSASVTEIQGKVGETIKSLVKDITPTKSGLKFGAWYVNNNELTDTAKLTEKGVTLKAGWLVEYKVNVYKQNLDQTGYECTTESFYASVGKKVSADYAYEGFSEIEKEDSLTELTLDSDKSKNVMNIYFDRDTYTITFRSNYQDETKAEEVKTLTLVYGQSVLLPNFDFVQDGYYLLGWSDKVDGDILYDAHYIDNLPINGEYKDVEDVTLTTSRNMSLYAIWNKGYNDMFGGNDYIYLVPNDNEIIYLCRGDIYFVGEYFEDDKSFIFYNDQENLEGKIFDDHTFAYYNVSRDEYNATLYKVGTGLVETEKILFDPYNGITYSIQVEEGKTEESHGTYTIDENGYYVASFTDGLLQDKVLTIVIGTVTLNDVKSDAFQVRNEEEVGLGKLVRFVVNEGQLTYYTQAYDMTLTGFGTLVYNTGSSKSTYYYTYDEETKTLTLTSSSGSTAGICKVMTVNNVNGYMFYNESLDKEFTSENGSKLVLDGVSQATYTNNDVSVTGYYTLKSSAFGGYIVTFTNGGVNYTFLTRTESEEKVIQKEGEEDSTETITNYYFDVKPEGYAEYYYKNENGTYYAPLVVINDKKEGCASIYGYTTSKTYELVLEGTYVYDANTKLYTFTTETVLTPEVLTDPYDITTINSIIMSLDTTSTKYAINFWYSSTINGETTEYEVKYTSADGAKLSLIAGIAIYSKDGYVISGSYSTKDGMTTITTTSSTYVYLEIDEENKTFITLSHAPYSAYVVMKDGSYSKKEYITFDGKGNGTYSYYVTEKVLKEGSETEYEDKDVLKTFVGTVQKLDETTKQGITIYKFTSEEKTFNYLLLSNSQAAFVYSYNDEVNGDYTSKDGILHLDGFSYYASYTDKDGNEYEGIYILSEDNVIMAYLDNMYRYFDLSEKSFTIRGKEYGTYIEFDNQGAPGNYISLDGYGKASIFKYNKTEDSYDKVDIDENGKYTIDGDRFTITYKEDNVTEKTLVGYLSTYTYSSTTYKTFVIEHMEVVQTFVNTKDWSILKLDAIGNATLYSNKGVKTTGTFMLISDSLLYFVNSDQTDANIYKYDTDLGTIVQSEFTARGYYTSDLKSLLFSQYGFAIFNNDTRYYYCMNGNDVIIYHQDASNPNANKYGFIEENFGEFLDVKEYGGLTYYSNDGYAVTFKRQEDTKDNYKVLVSSDPETYACLEDLVFTPSGSDTFTVTGSVKLNGKTYTCYVTRELVDENYVMYLTIGYYRFDINVTYGKSEGKTVADYEVIGMQYIRQFLPYAYLNTYYYIYSFLGSSYASKYTNNIGTITIHKEFDINGDVTKDYLDLGFLDGSKAYDLNNTLLAKEGLEYTYENNYYKVSVEGSDGYTYNVYFAPKYHNAFSTYGYYLSAVTRLETLKDGDYELNIERVIVTDTSYPAGTIYKINLKNADEELTYSEVFARDDVYNYVVRTLDEDGKKIISTTYYEISLVTKDAGSVSEGETSEEGTEEVTVLKPYESMKVAKKDATTIYDSENKNYIDVVDGKVKLLAIDGYKYIVYGSEYNEETNTYTITLSDGVTYTVKVNENVATFTKVETENKEEA